MRMCIYRDSFRSLDSLWIKISFGLRIRFIAIVGLFLIRTLGSPAHLSEWYSWDVLVVQHTKSWLPQLFGHPWDSEAITEQGLQNTGNFSWSSCCSGNRTTTGYIKFVVPQFIIYYIAQTDKVANTVYLGGLLCGFLCVKQLTHEKPFGK